MWAIAHAAEQAALPAIGWLAWMETHLGIELGVATAGVIGAFASLIFMRELSAREAILAVLCGAGAAFYLTVPVVGYFGWPDAWKHACAFLLGLVGMNLLAGVVHLSRKWKANPTEFLTRLRK